MTVPYFRGRATTSKSDDHEIHHNLLVDAVNNASSGGSQPGAVRMLDLGVVTAADYLAGSATLYTPADGELFGPGMLRDVVALDNLNLSIVGDDFDPTAPDARPPFASIGSGTSQMFDSYEGRVSSRLVPTSAGPVRIGLNGNLDNPIAEVWVADTSYGTEDTLVEAGHIWANEGSGTSGSVKPDFAGNVGGSVGDNDLVWDDLGVVTVGSAHVYAYVQSPVAFP